jgi:hypothetical protein
MKTFKLLTLILIVSIFVGCSKEVDLFNTTTTPGSKNPWENMTKTPTDVFGLIIDKNNQPIANADITVGNKTTTTDKNGFFIVTKASVVREHIYVQSQKNGYFNASRVLSYTTKDRAQVTIMMLENQKVADFQANTGGNAEVNGLKVKFPAGGYKYQNGGASYTGKVNVSMNYLDPTDPKIMLTMPGDLTAVNTNGEIKFLQTFGMTNVEMTDDNGKFLQLGTDKEAEITYPDKNLTIKGSKPTSVPLWYFDEKIGTWAEEGFATLTTAGYVGKVKHFSCWNCDYPGNKVKAKGRIIDQNGNPLVGVWVGLDLAGKGYGGHGSTNAYGEFEGCIPAGELLDFKVTDYRCNGTPLYSQQVGPFNADVVFPDVVVTVNPSNAINIKGTLKNCTNTGYRGFATAVLYNNLNQSIQTLTIQSDTFGVIDFNYINVCSTPISKIVITGYDQYNLKQSLEITTNNPGNVVNVGNIDVCQSLAEYLTVSIDGINSNTFLYSYAYDDITLFTISANDSTKGNYFFGNSIIPTGSTAPLSIGLTIQTILINNEVYIQSSSPLTINFSKLALISGDKYEGTINGNVKDSNNAIHTLTASFKVKRR